MELDELETEIENELDELEVSDVELDEDSEKLVDDEDSIISNPGAGDKS